MEHKITPTEIESKHDIPMLHVYFKKLFSAFKMFLKEPRVRLFQVKLCQSP